MDISSFWQSFLTECMIHKLLENIGKGIYHVLRYNLTTLQDITNVKLGLKKCINR